MLEMKNIHEGILHNMGILPNMAMMIASSSPGWWFIIAGLKGLW